MCDRFGDYARGMSAQPGKPKPALGLLVGVIVAWLGIIAVSYASEQITLRRLTTFRDDLAETLPWLAVLVAVAAALGLLMAIRSIGAGVLVGAGALLTVVGLAIQVLPLRQAWDLVKLFQVPGRNIHNYVTWDGSLLVLGVILLILGVRGWATGAKQTQQVLQDGPQYQPGYPSPQQPGQWPGYPGQQPPGQQQGQQPYPPQQSYPPQQHGGNFPG
jgi:uncharacterized membrane protein